MLDGDGSTSSATADGYSLKEKNMVKHQKRQRFSNDQIRSMESIFQCESKLAPQRKVWLANELGLEPRQVAIWFQNKRARWKSRQIERELYTLQSRYSSLVSQFQVLEKEKEWLISQVEMLRDQVKKKKIKEKSYHQGDMFQGGSLERGVGGDDRFCRSAGYNNWVGFEQGGFLNEFMGEEDDDRYNNCFSE